MLGSDPETAVLDEVGRAVGERIAEGVVDVDDGERGGVAAGRLDAGGAEGRGVLFLAGDVDEDGVGVEGTGGPDCAGAGRA